MFQAMFAIITPALMIGAFAERMRFGPYLAFITLWLLLVYCPLAHMVWGGGWIGAMGAKDFAGGLVVHMSSGYSALVAAIFLGKRRGFGKEPMPPHNLPFAVIGAALLWVGWFGFNAGSELMADGIAGLAFLTTSTAASTALVTWMVIEWLHRGKPDRARRGDRRRRGPRRDHAGLRVRDADGLDRRRRRRRRCSATRPCTFLKPMFGYDDSLDVFGVHGVGGTWGALATGLFIAPFALPEGVTRGAPGLSPAQEHRLHGHLRAGRDARDPARAARGLRQAARRRRGRVRRRRPLRAQRDGVRVGRRAVGRAAPAREPGPGLAGAPARILQLRALRTPASACPG